MIHPNPRRILHRDPIIIDHEPNPEVANDDIRSVVDVETPAEDIRSFPLTDQTGVGADRQSRGGLEGTVEVDCLGAAGIAECRYQCGVVLYGKGLAVVSACCGTDGVV